MDTSLPQFPAFSPSDNANTVSQRWCRWKDKFDNFLVGMNITNAKRQRALLRHYIGDEVDDVFVTLPNTGTDYISAIAALDSHFQSQQNTEFETYKFRQIRQEPQENINQFVTRLRKQASTCGFTDEDREVKSQIILGCNSGKLRRHALEHHTITLADLLKFARISETVLQHATAIENMVPQMAQLTTHRPKQEQQGVAKDKYKRNEQNNGHHSREKNWERPSQQDRKYKGKQHFGPDSETPKNCPFCGEAWHKSGVNDCRAKGKRCSFCNKLNHFAKVCRKRISMEERRPQTSNNSRQSANLAQTKSNTLDDDSDDAYVLSNGGRYPGLENYETVELQINNNKLPFVIDSGATVNLLSHRHYMKLRSRPPLHACSTKVYGYGAKEPMELLGMVTLEAVHQQKNYSVRFLVPKDGLSLVCKDTAVALGVIKFINHLDTYQNDIKAPYQEYEKLFKGMGKIKDVQVTLNVDPKIKPTIQKLRRVPYHMRIKVEEEIRDLLDKDIIESVPPNEPTPWVSPVVIVPKRQDERIRLCIDMKEANKAILRERSITPTMEDVMYKLNGAKLFSKLDMNKGYHQLALHPSSRAITTFVTHQGLYRYKRLHFGVNTAAEIFQHEVTKILQHIPNAINVSDDILVFGSSPEDHDTALHKTLKTLEDAGVTLNRDKCLFNKTTLKFLGHIFSEKGITPDPDKVQAIQMLDRPQNPSEIRSFLGMVTFASRFLPSLAITVKPLRQLTKQSQPWRWTEEHQQAFDKIKENLSRATTLSYFDEKMETEIWTDASPVGISAMLVQRANNGDMVILAYASHALTDTEQRYSQIEREALALIWSTHHFHLYLYGKGFKIVTDHKPLVSLFADNKHPLTARLERWKLKLQPYNYTVEYSPGKTNPTDYMSRHPIQSKNSTLAERIAEGYVNFTLEHAIPKTMTAEEIKQHTKKDNTLSSVLEALQTGKWNRHSGQARSRQWQAFFKIRHELSTTKSRDVVLRGPRIVMPQTLQHRVIELAHTGHQGIAKTKSLLREKVWFPSMDRQAETIVARCHKCNTVTPEQGITPLKMSTLPEGPWQTINVDHKGPLPNGDYLLVLVDQFSKFPVVEIVSSTAAKQNLAKLDHVFAIFGTPMEVITDNGPPFNSSEFAEFAKRLDFKHRKITPRWPQANGQVERFNATINKALRIAHSSNADYRVHVNAALRDYRTTPHCSTGCTPSELMFGYSLRSRIPDAKTLTHPIDRDTVHKNLEEMQQKAVTHHDTNKRELTPPTIGDKVLLRNETRMKTAPFYHIQPYTIVNIRGTMVTAQNESNKVTRHRSFYKILPKETEAPQTTARQTPEHSNQAPDISEAPIKDIEAEKLHTVEQPTRTVETRTTCKADEPPTNIQNRYNLRTTINKPKRLITD